MTQININAAKQDGTYSNVKGNSHETSIKISINDASFLLNQTINPGEDETYEMDIIINRDNIIEMLYHVIDNLPLYDAHGRLIFFSKEWCCMNLHRIYGFFGNEQTKALSISIKQYANRTALCIQNFARTFNIRDYIIAEKTTLLFDRGADNKVYLLFKYIDNDKSSNNIDYVQQIFYGAPGTGKSYGIKNYLIDKKTGEMRTDNNIRVTFHPDTDYASFVGCYKPKKVSSKDIIHKEYTVEDLKAIMMNEYYDEHAYGDKLHHIAEFCMDYAEYINGVYGKVEYDGLCDESIEGLDKGFITHCIDSYRAIKHRLINPEDRITYEFVAQAFTNAYVEAWKRMGSEVKESFYLIIEEINRGNCAQIFGDMFQLLDRNDDGFSSYGVTPDEDLKAYLRKELQGVENIEEEIRLGEIMKLPPTLSILATMNTSDQSLFPIDSAFKRRWEWKYVPIERGMEDGTEMDWKIEVGEDKYDWWEFLKEINKRIFAATESEDKQLGFFFIKAEDNIITAERFVNKVIFYLWNDVFKDTDQADVIFKRKVAEDKKEDGRMSFGAFYKGRNVNEEMLRTFFSNIELKKISVAQTDTTEMNNGGEASDRSEDMINPTNGDSEQEESKQQELF